MNCPLCSEPAILNCKCPRMDSKCKNGHWWHHCPVHMHQVNLGESDHSKADCTCGATTAVTVDFTESDMRILGAVDSDLRNSANMAAFYLRNKINNAILKALNEKRRTVVQG